MAIYKRGEELFKKPDRVGNPVTVAAGWQLVAKCEKKQRSYYYSYKVFLISLSSDI